MQIPHFSPQNHESCSASGLACCWVVVVVVSAGCAGSGIVGELDLPRDVSRDTASSGIVGDLDLLCDVSRDLDASSAKAIRLRAN